MKILRSIIYLAVALVLIIACEESFTDAGKSTDGTSGKGGSMARFAITGNNLFTVTPNHLKIYDITTPSMPSLNNSVNLDFGVETIFPYGHNLFIGTQSGMYIYDVSDPASPDRLSVYEHIYSCDPVVAEGQYAYVTLNSLNTWCGRLNNRLDIIDISDLYHPHLVKEYQMEGPRGLGVDGNLLFVCDNGLKVFDISNKTNIELLHHFNIKASDVIPNGNILLVTGEDGLYQYRYDNGALTFLSKISVNNN